MKRLILIDGNALVHRAFHALPPNMTAPDGTPTNAIFGFASILLKAIKDFKPDYMAAAFDLAGPTFRHEEFAEYKAHREKAPDTLYEQMEVVKKLLANFGVPVFTQSGYEADDLIGSLAGQARKLKDLETIILTGDLDTLQLVDDAKVKVFTARKGLSDTILYDQAAVEKRFGLKPEQVADFKGLKGDPSDNIPGVPGVGDKTATSLLQAYGTIEKVYTAIEKKNFKPSQVVSAKLLEKLKHYKDQALFSKKLATIVCDMKLDFSLSQANWQANFNEVAVLELFRSLGFGSLVTRLSGLGLAKAASLAGRQAQPALFAPSEAETANVVKRAGPEFKRSLEAVGRLYLLQVSGGVLVTTDGKSVALISEKDFAQWREIFSDPKIAKHGYYLREVYKSLAERGIILRGIEFDIKLAAYLVKPDLRDFSLANIFAWQDRSVGQANGQEFLPDEERLLLALPALADKLGEQLKELKLMKVFQEIELPLIRVLAEMERQGVKIDLPAIKELSIAVEKEVKDLEKKIYQLAGMEFNINSSQQLGQVLFERLNINVKVRKTGGGVKSTAASELEKMREAHPIVELILRYREVEKLKNTYIDPFPQLVDPKDGRLHTTFNQVGAVTGRLSSQDPNLQNIPIRSELGGQFRRAFVAAPGFKLISLDYSQIELRIVAHFSQDEKMLGAFKRGEDIHTRTAAEIFDVRPDQVSPNMRREAKALNFGILYGMGPLGFARSAGVNREQARQFIDKYLAEFSGVAAYIEKTKQQARDHGYVTTAYGRRRELPEINSGIPQLVAQAERMAVNAPAQGTAADIIKLAMVKIFAHLEENYGSDQARLLLQVHDELVLEVKTDLSEQIGRETKEIMENIWPVEIKIATEEKIGDNWAELRTVMN